jgi:phosphomannomutase
LIDLSAHFDYYTRTVTYKFDNFTESTIKDYIDSLVAKYSFNPRELNKKCPVITYTAMHGVGHPFITRAMATLGFNAMNMTAE